jgi:hypothetical protein
VSITTAPPVTVAELQAALRAVWAGQFRTRNGRMTTRSWATNRESGASLPGRVVLVVGCHGGAGASTVALAVAEAAAEQPGRSARLLDCASPERSGLLTAVDAELGVDGSGWRQGRRAQLPIDRAVDGLGSATEVPAPRHEPTGQVEVTVVDSGWSASDTLAGDSWLGKVAESAAIILVARATIPALRQLEQALATCPGDPVVVVHGPSRWARSAGVTAGPLLKAAMTAGRVVTVPSDRHLRVTGITSAPLPKAVAAAGRQIFARVLAADPVIRTAQNRPAYLQPILHERTLEDDHSTL